MGRGDSDMKTLPMLLLLPMLACSSGAAPSASMPMRLDDGSTAAVAHLRLDKMP